MKKFILSLSLIFYSMLLCSCNKYEQSNSTVTKTPIKVESNNNNVTTQTNEQIATSDIKVELEKENTNQNKLILGNESFPEFTFGDFVEKKSIDNEIHFYYENVSHFIELEEYTQKIVNMGYEVIGAWKFIREKHFHAKNDETYIDIILINDQCEIVIGNIDNTLKTKMAYKQEFNSIDELLPVKNANLLEVDTYDFPKYDYSNVTEEEFLAYITNLKEYGFYLTLYEEKNDFEGELIYEYSFCNKTGCLVSVAYIKEKDRMRVVLRNYASMILLDWAEDFD